MASINHTGAGIFIYADDAEYNCIASCLAAGARVTRLSGRSDLDGATPALQSDAVVFVDLDLPGALDFCRSREDHDGPAPLFVVGIAGPQVWEENSALLDGMITDCLRKPLSPAPVKMAVRRIDYYLNLHRKIRQLERETKIRNTTGRSEEVETERFIAVRQIVERITVFINQIAANVQGGIRYFNELQYFVSIHDLRCRVIAANPTYHKYLGNRINKNSWEIYTGMHGQKENSPVYRSIQSGNVLDTRATVQYQSGARAPVVVHTAPIYNNDGEVELVLEVFAGTKEIERLSQEIRTTQQRYEQLFDAVPSKVVVMDRRFRITAENRQFRKDFGNHLGDNFFDILRPGTFPAYRDPITLTVKTGLPHQGEMVLTDPSGIQYNMMTWTSPIKTATDKLIQVIAILGDVTELRRLQTDLSRLGLMISTVSHDLKGSLTGLDAGLYLIDKGFYRNKPALIEEGLDVSQLMVDRIRKMVFDILYSSKERELEREVVDVREFAEDIAANVGNRIRAAMIQFACSFEEDLGQMHADVGLLRSSLINILDNAVEACIEDTGPRKFSIQFSVKKEKTTALFQIQDNGSGINVDKKGRIFDLFYSSKGRKGTGLGLYITRKAIQKHGGTIEVFSEPGQGARFEVRLPLLAS
jgi:signal transduction histidine kinase